MQNDPVNHPSHYTDGKYETIDFIEYYRLEFHEGNAIKYLSRAGKKEGNDAVQDLKKALWYMKRALEFDKRVRLVNHGKISESAIHPMDYARDKNVIPGVEGIIWDIVTVGKEEDAIAKLDTLIKFLESKKEVQDV